MSPPSSKTFSAGGLGRRAGDHALSGCWAGLLWNWQVLSSPSSERVKAPRLLTAASPRHGLPPTPDEGDFSGPLQRRLTAKVIKATAFNHFPN